MAKYTDEFKLAVVQYYLAGHSKIKTANRFSMTESLVHRWVARYRLHGSNGIKRRTGKTNYSVEYKLDAVRLVTEQGISLSSASARLNLPDSSILLRWLKQYRQYGIDGLKTKPKDRKSVKKQLKAVKKADHLKTKKELMEELLYLRAEMAVLKKLDALIREEEARQREAELSQD